ncbi:MAG TPA: hypothetical protein VH165_03545 [Kofleriaceae bacterium]|nr:hypothetical protein [Kofleriaceae bacterium]
MLSLQGTLHEGFDGRRLAESARTKKLIVSMRDVRRFASWGMTEWMEFLRLTADCDLYLVECSTYAAGQLNLVTGLLGHSKLVSFYAAYRCGSCGEEIQSLLLVPRDRAAIRNLAGSQHDCKTCGGQARMEDYPAAFFETMTAQPPFDIDDEVLAVLRSQLRYDLVPDLSRFRAFRRTLNDYSYLRLSGSLALLPSHVLAEASVGTAIVDLASVMFDPAEIAPWRLYIEEALPKLKSLQLLDCPAGFLDSAVVPADLSTKLKVRTFAVPYDCFQCETASVHTINVADNLEQLVRGIVPAVTCTSCQSPLVAALTPEQLNQLRILPARARDPELDRFLAQVRPLPSEQLENCLTARSPSKLPAAPRSNRTMVIALAVGTLLIGGLAAVAITLWTQRAPATPPVVLAPVVASPARAAFTRPDWILFDEPASAYCQETINRLTCIGVSAFRPTREDGVTEANDAALEELINTIGLKISEPFFRDNVIPGYTDARAKALSALQTADVDRSSRAYLDAVAAARKARKRVVEVLRASGGAMVPSERSDWYWEEYAGEHGKPNEVLVFVRYDVPLDAVRGLVERYSATSSAQGMVAMTAFPGVAWQSPEFTGGALLTKIGKPPAGATLAPASLVVAVGGQQVVDAQSFVRRLGEAERAVGAISLTVKTGDAPAQVIELRH